MQCYLGLLRLRAVQLQRTYTVQRCFANSINGVRLLRSLSIFLIFVTAFQLNCLAHHVACTLNQPIIAYLQVHLWYIMQNFYLILKVYFT